MQACFVRAWPSCIRCGVRTDLGAIPIGLEDGFTERCKLPGTPREALSAAYSSWASSRVALCQAS